GPGVGRTDSLPERSPLWAGLRPRPWFGVSGGSPHIVLARHVRQEAAVGGAAHSIALRGDLRDLEAGRPSVIESVVNLDVLADLHARSLSHLRDEHTSRPTAPATMCCGDADAGRRERALRLGEDDARARAGGGD